MLKEKYVYLNNTPYYSIFISKNDNEILPSSLEALFLKGVAISSVFLERASRYCAADQSFNLSSISGVQHVGPVGQICSDTPVSNMK